VLCQTRTETSNKEILANLNKLQVAKILLKVNKTRVRTNNARDKDKDSKDNRDHKVAGSVTASEERKAHPESKVINLAAEL